MFLTIANGDAMSDMRRWLSHHATDSLLNVVQVNGVKEAADFVSKLRRVGKGLGVYQLDAVRMYFHKDTP